MNKKRSRYGGLTVQELAAMGGKARAKKLSKERQSQIGRQAINVRWKRERERKRIAKEK